MAKAHKQLLVDNLFDVLSSTEVGERGNTYNGVTRKG